MGVFSWLGGRDNPKETAASADRTRRHRQAKPKRTAQRFEDGGRCPAGYWHTGRCRHR
jgi:hypothetical protein